MLNEKINILLIGDIIGRPGRRFVKKILPYLKEREKISLTIANGENSAGGIGITSKVLNELKDAGIDIITTGNHIFSKKEIISVLNEEKAILRPANFPTEVPGRGWVVVDIEEELKVGVLNLMGRTFMGTLDCPFKVAEKEIEKIKNLTPIIVVDFHAEATSEKNALGHFLAGKVSAVIGTHTHVATSDERIIQNWTAYITDVGMTGPFDSILGMQKEKVITKFLTQMPQNFEVAEKDVRLEGVVIEVEKTTGRSTNIKRIREIEEKIEEGV
jgi:metallophosphoesterase (TIGR00282 family)